MKRETYNNGDHIGLKHCGCDGCNPSMINGILCHEHSCPDSWRDYELKCRECGCEFYPDDNEQYLCFDCRNPHDCEMA